MIIKPRQKKLPRNIKLSLNSENLKESDCVKYLGVLIDKNLTCKNHINRVTTKVAKSIGILSKLRHFAPKKVLIIGFNAFISPYINYGIINWGGTYPGSLDELNKYLKKAATYITFKSQKEPSKPISKELNSLNLKDTYKLECAKFIFDIFDGKYNSLYSHLFHLTKNQHNINTRQATSGRFYTPTVRTNYKKYNITSYSGVKSGIVFPKISENPYIRNPLQNFIRECCLTIISYRLLSYTIHWTKRQTFSPCTFCISLTFRSNEILFWLPFII